MAPRSRTDQRSRLLREFLFGVDGSRTFAVLDGASVPGLLDKLYGDAPEFECLYRGELKPDLAEVAPYLVRLAPESDFSNWVLDQGWGKHWGIFMLSSADLPLLRQHFRRFLTIYEQDTGKPLLFRYYDPRVLRTYLPTCSKEESTAFFGPAKGFVCEGETPEIMVRFRVVSGALTTEQKEIEAKGDV